MNAKSEYGCAKLLRTLWTPNTSSNSASLIESWKNTIIDSFVVWFLFPNHSNLARFGSSFILLWKITVTYLTPSAYEAPPSSESALGPRSRERLAVSLCRLVGRDALDIFFEELSLCWKTIKSSISTCLLFTLFHMVQQMTRQHSRACVCCSYKQMFLKNNEKYFDTGISKKKPCGQRKLQIQQHYGCDWSVGWGMYWLDRWPIGSLNCWFVVPLLSLSHL